jgi:site-specific recombinase XerD
LEYSDKNLTLQLRDKALFAFLIVAGTRASEAVILKRNNSTIPNRIEVAQVETEKNGLLRKRIIMPLEGNLHQ